MTVVVVKKKKKLIPGGKGLTGFASGCAFDFPFYFSYKKCVPGSGMNVVQLDAGRLDPMDAIFISSIMLLMNEI